MPHAQQQHGGLSVRFSPTLLPFFQRSLAHAQSARKKRSRTLQLLAGGLNELSIDFGQSGPSGFPIPKHLFVCEALVRGILTFHDSGIGRSLRHAGLLLNAALDLQSYYASSVAQCT